MSKSEELSESEKLHYKLAQLESNKCLREICDFLLQGPVQSPEQELLYFKDQVQCNEMYAEQALTAWKERNELRGKLIEYARKFSMIVVSNLSPMIESCVADRVKDLERKVRVFEDMCDNFKQQLHEEYNKHAKEIAHFKSLQKQQTNEAEQRLKILQDNVTELENGQAKSSSRIQSLEFQLKHEKSQTSKKLIDSNSKLAKTQAELAEAKKLLTEREAAHSEVKTTVASLQNELAICKTQVQTSKSQMSESYMLERAILKANEDQYKMMIKELEEENSKLKSSVAAFKMRIIDTVNQFNV